ncbi:thioesterase family protein [uncultured Deefgea sp.]|uniref:acyl-CoA thioesterase n=1 Tax=uncultured Deefgea sp. TaxID=1304914 RepID=UPI0026055C05|nr:thioesterase family protein [uncultured Deefgea sp.]
MPRIKLDLPECNLFQCNITVRITDINYGQHLAHDALLGLLHEARLQWLASLGYRSEVDIGGAGLILSDVAVIFLHEAFYGDVLQIRLGIDEISQTRFELYYDVSTQVHPIAKAKTTMACFSYTERKITSLPILFRQAIKSQEQQ